MEKGVKTFDQHFVTHKKALRFAKQWEKEANTDVVQIFKVIRRYEKE